MTARSMIRLNDLTDHGGKVITSIDNCVYQGVPVATKGDLVNCPKYKCEKCPAIGNVTMVWEKTTSYSEITIAYQTKIAGTIYNPELNIIETWLCMDTNFDGWKPAQCLFLEAKANYDQFFKNGEPNGFYRKIKLGKKKLSGHDNMLKQARKQNEVYIALNNIPKSHWHFLQFVSYSYFTETFAPYLNIKTFNTMMS
ncbi:Tox-REase-5 domain-containing protein [Photorhabdus khanii]|uniref:Tox-REase-5 domain-containing protein n=1 Tax=Photorhabdus khanii subsp. guanajuatensis TaxID=2100166 RepID=A0A4R4IW01_9GAMM|nr:Tox-REase-5 domain-containing protein [Photorhabdus khanii]TDB45073.1 hypothetical protein C5467_22560 [Photorhabdus khanii subsp. guanajuatensis]